MTALTMAGVFNNAWILLKNRGLEPVITGEDRKAREVEQLLDDLQDTRTDIESGAFEPHQTNYFQLSQKLRQLGRTGGFTAPDDPMLLEQQRQEAADIEAEGIDLPDGSGVSAVPPPGIGRAGSSNPARARPINVFNPAGVKLQQEQQRLRSQLKPILGAEELLRPSPAPNEFITADDFMRPPVKKSFDTAWTFLKGTAAMRNEYGEAVHPAAVNYAHMAGVADIHDRGPRFLNVDERAADIVQESPHLREMGKRLTHFYMGRNIDGRTYQYNDPVYGVERTPRDEPEHPNKPDEEMMHTGEQQ